MLRINNSFSNDTEGVDLFTWLTLLVVFWVSSACSEVSDHQFITVKQFDEFVSLTKNKQGQLFFQSKPSDTCGSRTYWRENVAYFYVNETVGHISQPLNELIDINSIQMTKYVQYQYYFEDKNHTYMLLKTLCDHSVMYQPKTK